MWPLYSVQDHLITSRDQLEPFMTPVKTIRGDNEPQWRGTELVFSQRGVGQTIVTELQKLSQIKNYAFLNAECHVMSSNNHLRPIGTIFAHCKNHQRRQLPAMAANRA